MKRATPIQIKEMVEAFWDPAQLRLNDRRLEHLASLGLDLTSKRVLEVGAGIGDLSLFFIDRRCEVTITDGRSECASLAETESVLRNQRPRAVMRLDLDSPKGFERQQFDIVFCYGVLHLLQRPEGAIDFMAARCGGLLLLECEIEPGDGGARRPIEHPPGGPAGPLRGAGRRPTEAWLISRLKSNFAFVWKPVEPPHHPAFAGGEPTRAVYVASRGPLGPASLRRL